MRRSRSLALLMILAALLSACTPGTASASAERRTEISQDGESVVVIEADEALLEYTLGEWRGWAEENLTDTLGEPVRIGPNEQPPSSFGMFIAAELSPHGNRLAIAPSTYAMLTTVSVVGILDLDERELSVVEEPAFGGVSEFHWSPDSNYIAYPLDTARAGGDRLRVDDVRRLRPAAELEGEEFLEAARRLGHEVAVDARQWLPEVRNLEWTNEGVLLFTTNGLGEGELRWRFDPETGELELL